MFVVCAAPYLLTGFMHLDGFMDVTDAVRSYRSLERRREILKDSHVGSFAVIGVALVLIGQFSAVFQWFLNAESLSAGIILIPVISRCCSVLAVLCLKPIETSQYVNRQRKHLWLPIAILLIALGCGFWVRRRLGIALAAEVLGFGLALWRAYHSLKGMNGDISGYSLTLAELVGLAVMTVFG